MNDTPPNETELNLWAYPPKKKVLGPRKIELTPLTKITRHIINQHFRENKNLVLVYPSSTFDFLPILSYEFMKREKRDVMVFTRDKGRIGENPYEKQKRKYSLLADKNKRYLFYDFIPGVLYEEGRTVEVRVGDALHLPRAKRGIKSKIKSRLKNLSDRKEQFEKQLLLFQNNELRHRNIKLVNSLIYKDAEYSNVPLDIGLLVFENLNSKIWNQKKVEEFSEWIEPCIKEGIQLIFHISNYTDLEYIDMLREKTDSIVLYLPRDLLEKNRDFFYGRKSKKLLARDTLKKYNLDSEEMYSRHHFSLSKKTVEGQGTGTKQCWKLLSKATLEEEDRKSIRKILWRLPRLFIHPSSYKIPYQFQEGSYRNIGLDTFLNLFEEKIERSKSPPKNKELLSKLVILYDNFKETKRYGEDLSYSKKSKPYELMSFIQERKNEWKDGGKRFLIGTFDGFERNKLEKKLNGAFGPEFGEVKTLRNLNYLENHCQKDKVLILPSPPPSEYFCLLLRDYEEIVIFCYKGWEEKRFREQQKLVGSISKKFLQRAVKSFDRIYDYFDWNKNNVPDGFSSLKEGLGEGITRETRGNNIQEDVKEEIKKEELEELKKQEDEFEKFSSSELSLEGAKEEDLAFKISRFPERKPTREIHLPSSESLIKIEGRENKFRQKNAREIEKGDLIILIDKEERKSLVELLSEEIGLEKDLDTTHLAEWKKRLREYISVEGLSVKEFYRTLSEKSDISYQAVLSWVHGEVIGPRNPEDLRRIGEIINYPYLVEEYENLYSDMEKLRNAHQKVGRRIEVIIKNKLEGKKVNHEFSFDEFSLSRRLTVYRVESISSIE